MRLPLRPKHAGRTALTPIEPRRSRSENKGKNILANNSPGKWRLVMKVSNVEPPEAPLLTPERFRATPEFRKFKGIMRKILKVPKAELDHRVRTAKRLSPRSGNPNAPGRKPKS